MISPDPIDLRLVVCDMDGTLLDADKQLPPELPAMLERLHEAGVVFCPASGRQHATLVEMFPDLPGEAVLIAENGAYVTAGGAEVSASPLPLETVRRIVAAMDELAATEDLGVIVCASDTAYVDRTDEDFRVHVDPHYAEVTDVPSLAELLAAPDAAQLLLVKVAVYAAAGPERAVVPALTAVAGDEADVVVSGPHYVDVMAAGTHKGQAVAALRTRLGLTHDQVAVFGDAPNDAEMMAEGTWTFAVANAHDEVRARARFGAPAHTEDGVLRTLTRLLDGERPDAPGW
ncbi:Cof-type HAD-IIB family hydrolase [Nocardioidaceae bacterium]|nr:Cof-type HAD-IIB family hydrolase [Nocardioidaceae bacterium]